MNVHALLSTTLTDLAPVDGTAEEWASLTVEELLYLLLSLDQWPSTPAALRPPVPRFTTVLNTLRESLQSVCRPPPSVEAMTASREGLQVLLTVAVEYASVVQASTPLREAVLELAAVAVRILSLCSPSTTRGAVVPVLVWALLSLEESVVVAHSDRLTSLLRDAGPLLFLPYKEEEEEGAAAVLAQRALLRWCVRVLKGTDRGKEFFSTALQLLFLVSQTPPLQWMPVTGEVEQDGDEKEDGMPFSLLECYSVLGEFAKRSKGDNSINERERAFLLEFTDWMKECLLIKVLPSPRCWEPSQGEGEEEGGEGRRTFPVDTVAAFLEEKQREVVEGPLRDWETHLEELRDTRRRAAHTERQWIEYIGRQYASVEEELGRRRGDCESNAIAMEVWMASLRRLVSLRVELALAEGSLL